MMKSVMMVNHLGNKQKTFVRYTLNTFIHTYSVDEITWKTGDWKYVKIKDFTSPVGPTKPLPSTVLELFLCFFTRELLQIIVDQTNHYAISCIVDQWNDITMEELMAYLGFMILMGLVPLPSIHDYWQRSPVFHYSPIADKISRDRFCEIQRFLHFVDNDFLQPYGSDGYDRLGKVRPIIDHLVGKYLEMYNPNKQVSIDEAMVPYKGRSSMKQYLPKKPVKRGFKIWMRGDSINGYISELEVYTGKQGNKVEVGLGRRVVETLTAKLKEKHHHIYFDNYFSSVDLLLSLSRCGLYGCGTLRSNRKGFPDQLKSKVKKGLKERGDSEVVQCGNYTVYLWQDTRPVLVISSNSQANETVNINRKKKDGSIISVKCPHAIALYNKYMGGVDLNDQIRKYYHIRLKSKKYYKYLFWFLFDLTITNAYILSKHYSAMGIKTMKEFRITLANALIGDYNTRKRLGLPSSSQPLKKPKLEHFPFRGAEKSRRCYMCNKKKIRSETVWYCRECQVFLCHNGKHNDCFYEYHK